jgi:C4-dicarboxylate-specific signal transduction histidine kinase
MSWRVPRSWPWVLVAAVAGVAGAAWIARDGLARQREAFETDARIMHRLLSQRAVQHDAILATLALLQPGGGTADAPEQRLPALYPQVLQVIKRERQAAWDDARLRAAEDESRRAQRAALAAVDAAGGRFTLVRAAEPASYALVIDVARMVPWAEWPAPRDGPVGAALQGAGARFVVQPGEPAGGVRRFAFAKHLAADSHPFDLVASRPVGIAQLPWPAMLAWCAVVAAVAAALAAWRRQRDARRRAEELLRLGQVGRLNALGELAAGMAHELNQPLAALLANTQAARRLVDDDPPDLATARTAMDRAADQARRASEVVARLRRLVQRPDSAAAARPLALADAARSVVQLLEREAARRGVRLRLDASSAGATVVADPVAIEQIVHNLVMNGLQALEQVPERERELVVEVDRGDGTTVALTVRDSGPGIAPEALPRVFEPFFTTRSSGLGLGLSLCETLAQGMGGTLVARNRAPRGAEFRLTLPAAA